MATRTNKKTIVLQESLKEVNKIWKKEGLAIDEPLSEREIIRTFFSKLGVVPCRKVFEVYSNLGGMSKWETDSTCFSFWTIEMILEENQPNSDLIFFADFLIKSHRYGFRIEDEDISSIHIYYGKTDIEKVAGSFAEFFEIYLKTPERLELFERESDKILKL